jgi:integrase
VGTVSLGYGADGKRIRKTVYAASKKDVSDELRKVQVEHDAGRLVEADGLTTGEYLARWLASVANSVGATTWERYRHMVELRLTPILGKLPLQKLRPLHVEQAYTAIKDSATAATSRVAGTVLGIALRHAVRLKLIPSNPAADVKKTKSTAREMLFMTTTHAKRFLDAAKSSRLYPLYQLALTTGMRQGELLAMNWADVDFEKNTIAVRRALTMVKGELVTKEPKSKSSRRTITVPPFAMNTLREHRAAALKAGLITSPVFCTRTGGYLEKKNVWRSFKAMMSDANERAGESDKIPDGLRFHDLRHSHATALVAAGCSIKAVSRRLGHADVAITLRVYSHVMPDDDEKLATQAGMLFG